MRLLALVVLFTTPMWYCSADEPDETRTYWAYEGGWFAKLKDDSWYELNELTYRKLGKPSQFREVKRTKQYVELYDEGRKVGIRLFEKEAQVRNSDREDAAWQKLYTGRWKTPTPAE